MNFFRICALALVSLSGALNLSALELGNQFNFSAGYRNDIISAHNTITEVSGVATKDALRMESLDIGQVGFDFRFVPPDCDCCCEHPCLNNLYLDGYAYWGWTGNEDFERSTFSETAGGALLSSVISHGRQKARTQDFQIGLGFLVFNCDCWSVGLAGGYAYDKQHIRTSHGSSSVLNSAFVDNPLYDGLVFKQHWQGPWIGTEVFYSICNTLIDVGYEYHFAHYHASFNVPADTSDFSDVRTSKSAYGNVAYINAHFPICENWLVGLGFTYKQFRTRHCHMHPRDGTFEDVGYPPETTGSASAKWISYSILADVGYAF